MAGGHQAISSSAPHSISPNPHSQHVYSISAVCYSDTKTGMRQPDYLNFKAMFSSCALVQVIKTFQRNEQLI